MSHPRFLRFIQRKKCAWVFFVPETLSRPFVAAKKCALAKFRKNTHKSNLILDLLDHCYSKYDTEQIKLQKLKVTFNNSFYVSYLLKK